MGKKDRWPQQLFPMESNVGAIYLVDDNLVVLVLGEDYLSIIIYYHPSQSTFWTRMQGQPIFRNYLVNSRKAQ